MFFFLPYGHDQPVYDRPWITILLVAACTLVFGGTWVLQVKAELAFLDAVTRVEAVTEQHPQARVGFTIEGLPEQLDEVIRPLVDATPGRAPRPGDAQLEAAMLDAIAAMNQMPLFRFGYRPGAPNPGTAIAHAFMHADIFHLVGNMLLLWLAGGVLECFWRRWAFVLLYFGAAASGLAAHHLANIGSLAPMIGASGAIAGLLGAFVVGYPRTRIRIFYFVFFGLVRWGTWYAPAWFVIPLWAGLELLHAALGTADGVAYWAHVGGFALGVVAALLAHRLRLVAVDAGHEIAPREASVRPQPASASAQPPEDRDRWRYR